MEGLDEKSLQNIVFETLVEWDPPELHGFSHTRLPDSNGSLEIQMAVEAI